MALLTTQSVTRTGLNPVNAVAANAGGDTIRISDRTMLYVKNADAASKTVTIDIPGNTSYGAPNPEIPVIVAAGAIALIGPIDSVFLQPGTSPGVANITYSAVTSVTVAAVQL